MNDKLVQELKDMALYEDWKAAGGIPDVAEQKKAVFRSKAYKNAAQAIQGLGYELKDASQTKGLPGIGKAIYEKIESFLICGSFPAYEAFKQSPAAKLKPLMEVPGIGVKTALKLLTNGITTPAQLQEMCDAGTCPVVLPNQIKIGLKNMNHTDKTRMTMSEHDSIVEPILREIEAIPEVVAASATGSARRDDGSIGYTVGDADLVVGISNESAVSKIQAILKMALDEIIVMGSTKVSGVKNKKQVDVRIVDFEDYGALLLHSTGPESFNVACRKIAMKNGWKLNEYGLFDVDTGRVISKDEVEILDKLGIGWIEPRDRKNFTA